MIVLAGFLLLAPVPIQGDAVSAPDHVVARMNPGASLSEDAAVAEALGRSLDAFLTEARDRAFTERCVDPASLLRTEFFFQGLSGLGSHEGSEPPTVLKSYTTDGSTYFVTVAFTAVREEAPFLSKIVELRATPKDEGFRFDSPFTERTADFRATNFGTVTFHHRNALDDPAAREFADFKEELCRLAGAENEELDYYVFQSLDELLKCYGFVYDAHRCNFLFRDLGFSDDGGRVFATGTGNPHYAFEYVGEFLKHHVADPDELYGPFVVGISTCYGGYGLSGESVDELKGQFRKKLFDDPETDFLAEFKKGRKSSVQRHFSHFVLSAFLCEEILAKHGFEAALRLASTGQDGARFFEELNTILGINETNFHATIRLLIEA
ncbi:hypothetical protein Poly30_52900 [Planctomycetes bacterium Poly30]|uniref:Uncharacterized protein n=1 Tax=Saltatorellus ferox TaxID=2528018 RepID=A0A518F081_9BACT|nr:hypothetical protein Poly30_52900 [Planctomycetes bacterium Poly30]